MEWHYRSRPRTDSWCGWYAVLKCWDPEEGLWPDAYLWCGMGWAADEDEYPPVVAVAGPFASEADADRWAEENDPDWCPRYARTPAASD